MQQNFLTLKGIWGLSPKWQYQFFNLFFENLVFNGQKLPDEQTLEEVGIDSENNSLCLVVSLRVSPFTENFLSFFFYLLGSA